MKTLKESLNRSLNENRINFKRLSTDIVNGKVNIEDVFDIYYDDQEGLEADEFLQDFSNWLQNNGADEVTANDVIENEREDLLELAFDAAVIDEY